MLGDADCPVVHSITKSASKITSCGVSIVCQSVSMALERPTGQWTFACEYCQKLGTDWLTFTCAHKNCTYPKILCKLDDACMLIRCYIPWQDPNQHVTNGSFPPSGHGRGPPHRATQAKGWLRPDAWTFIPTRTCGQFVVCVLFLWDTLAPGNGVSWFPCTLYISTEALLSSVSGCMTQCVLAPQCLCTLAWPGSSHPA